MVRGRVVGLCGDLDSCEHMLYTRVEQTNYFSEIQLITLLQPLN